MTGGNEQALARKAWTKERKERLIVFQGIYKVAENRDYTACKSGLNFSTHSRGILGIKWTDDIFDSHSRQ